MKILITGAAGFLGRNLLTNLLRETSYDIYAAHHTKTIPEFEQRRDFVTICCDITQPSQARSLLRQVEPDCIIHLAGKAIGQPDNDNFNLVDKVNIIGTHNLVHLAPKGCRFINASTVTVYGDWGFQDWGDSFRYRESDCTKPTSVYGVSKLAAENIVNVHTNTGDISGVNLRFCAMIGPDITHGAPWHFIRKLKSDSDTMTAIGDYPGSTKPYLHVYDAMSAIKTFIETDRVGEFNVVPDDEISIEKVAKSVMSGLGIYKDIEWLGEEANWPTDNRLISCSNRKLKTLGWNLQYPLSEDAVRDAVAAGKPWTI